MITLVAVPQLDLKLSHTGQEPRYIGAGVVLELGQGNVLPVVIRRGKRLNAPLDLFHPTHLVLS
jgi:hypothetical protein